MSQVLTALNKIMGQPATAKLTKTVTLNLSQLLSHVLAEVKGFDSLVEKDASSAKNRLRALKDPLTKAAAWLKETTEKALAWEDTMSWQVSVEVYEDPSQLMPRNEGTVDPRDNNARPASNQASNQADFMMSFKEMLASLQTKSASLSTPAPSIEKTETIAAPAEPLSWPLDMARKDVLSGNLAPEQKNDYGKDHPMSGTWMLPNTIHDPK